MAGPGIGIPFNVQHVAHIGADNVEALLLAAKDDPKLLPSFCFPRASSMKKMAIKSWLKKATPK
ncbi:Synaptojanin-1 [Desmophyllum pertusum]|uniref:Synaptojanin-1 n=1 Tax=Desmophyllum pertusum TaxID=174260 RepID=A0A9W9ZJ72_9CNID|nr:Synaptojanin-1 [Desmophyllum pertusum]